MAVLMQEGDDEAYRAFIQDSPAATIYHTLEWKAILEETYGYQPLYLLLKEQSKITGVLPLFKVQSSLLGSRLVSLPFSHQVNILSGEDVSVLEELVIAGKSLTRRHNCAYLELKPGHELPAGYGFLSSSHFYNSVLDLSPAIDQIWQKFDRNSMKWGIHHASKSGLKVRRGSKLEDYHTFYQFEVATRKHQGSPVYPLRFFTNLFKHLGSSPDLKLYLAYSGTQCIGGIIIICHSRRAIFAYSATLKDKETLAKQPAKLLVWEAIQDLKSLGIVELDFGTTHFKNDGLLKFKSHWGARNVALPYYYFLNKRKGIPAIDRTNLKMRLASSILKSLPVPVFKMVSPFLLRQVG
jgi:hypothetical protein